MNQQLETVACKVCDRPMPKLRRELYGYDFCVKCSNVQPKVGRIVTYGQGDHTWNDLEVLDQDAVTRVLELESLTPPDLKSEMLSFEEDADESLDKIANQVKSDSKILADLGLDQIVEEPASEDQEDVTEEVDDFYGDE
jgi:protein-tyrosine phosphatase